MNGFTLFGMWVGGFLIGISVGMGISANDVEQEAFQRGYMVECAGVEGYYWECEE